MITATTLCISLTFAAVAAQAQVAPRNSRDWRAVDSLLGRQGSAQAGDVMKYSLPRSDLDVSVDGLKLKPAFALGSWVAFKRVGAGRTAVAGDLVLTEDEISPVMSKLQAISIEQTAVHNHLLRESPRIMYVHIHAQGNEVTIARAIREALSLTKTPLTAPASAPTTAIDLDTAAVANALGYRGKVNGGVYQVSIPRAQKILDAGMEMPASMGLATAINFQPSGNGNAAITGDFVMTSGEVNKVIRALTANGIQITALHSHMLNESPRLFFMHFWGNANAVTLAWGLHAALREMRVSSQ
jgi:uncharacterized protein DUF1259